MSVDTESRHTSALPLSLRYSCPQTLLRVPAYAPSGQPVYNRLVNTEDSCKAVAAPMHNLHSLCLLQLTSHGWQHAPEA